MNSDGEAGNEIEKGRGETIVEWPLSIGWMEREIERKKANIGPNLISIVV